MPDFTSALYLGIRHSSCALGAWDQLTAGKPAALDEWAEARSVAGRLAELQGFEAATLAPSTLHLFWDVLGMLAAGKEAVYMDAGVYPIARWGVERARARGVRVYTFRHHDPADLERRLARDGAAPVIVCDGFCPTCGGAAPVAEYRELAIGRGGRLLIDDTQALGILGHSPRPEAPYGYGGGGSLRWAGARREGVLALSSLAKAFGAPVAVLAGSGRQVREFESRSETRVHCSPPSITAVRAAERALSLNEQKGEALRARLAGLVRYFKARVPTETNGLFPVQTVRRAHSLYVFLRMRGIRSVLHQARGDSAPRVSFLITARHSTGDIDLVMEALHARTIHI